MQTLNLIRPSKSDIKFNIIQFPDGEPHIVLEEFDRKVPVKVITIGELVNGKAISSITINGVNASQYETTIYGDEETLDGIDSVPVTIDINGNLFIPSDATVESITVTATSVYKPAVTGTATITVAGIPSLFLLKSMILYFLLFPPPICLTVILP